MITLWAIAGGMRFVCLKFEIELTPSQQNGAFGNMKKHLISHHLDSTPENKTSTLYQSWKSIRMWLRGNRRVTSYFAGFLILTILCMATLAWIYTHQLQTMVDEENYSYLEEIAVQINRNLNQGMNDNYATLETISRKVKQNQFWSLEEIMQDLATESKIYGYQQLILVDEKANIYVNGRKKSYPSLIPTISEMQERNQPVTSEIVGIDGYDCVAFVSPLQDVTIEGTRFIGIAAIVDIHTLGKILSLTLFDGQGFAHVVTSKGNMVLCSENTNNSFQGYNIISHLQHVTFLDNTTIDIIFQDFKNGQSRKIHYMDKGVETLSLYSPTGYEDWFLYTIIPADVLLEKSQRFYMLTVTVCFAIAALFLLLIAVIFLTLVKNKWELLHLLHTDPITQGRSMVKFKMDIAQSLRQKNTPYCLVYANIERFKLINEQAGQKDADMLLQTIYDIFNTGLEEDESVCRIMADHFGIFLYFYGVPLLEQRISDWNQLIQRYTASRHLPAITLSYGVTTFVSSSPKAEMDVALLLDQANLARKEYKKVSASLPHIAVYDDKLEQKVHLEQFLEGRQEVALQNDEFALFLQPKYDPVTERIVGAESLVRWITPDNRMLFPDQYIPLFENNGFIVNLDLNIFEKTCQFIRGMIDRGKNPIPISVNLSRVNLNNPNFLERYIEVWSRYHFDAKLIEFEITENLIYDNTVALNKIISEIHENGFLVSMDDFGSGYSSLNMLKEIDIDTIKLDKNFFQKAAGFDKATTIIYHIIDLAKDLGMKIVAEGVEIREQVDFLREQGCDYIQGYYYSKPLPAATVEAMLEEQDCC